MASQTWFTARCLGCVSTRGSPAFEPVPCTLTAEGAGSLPLQQASFATQQPVTEIFGSIKGGDAPEKAVPKAVDKSIAAPMVRAATLETSIPSNLASSDGEGDAWSYGECNDGCSYESNDLRELAPSDAVPVVVTATYQRKRDRIRRLGIKLQTVVVMRASERSKKIVGSPSLASDISSEVGSLSVPTGTPVFIKHLDTVSVESIKAALGHKFLEEAPLVSLLRNELGASELDVSPWVDGTNGSGVLVQRKRYIMPTPDDLPDVLRKALKLPETFPGQTVSAFGHVGESLVLVQRSKSDGIPFGDRVRFQSTHTFKSHPAGGVEWRSWVETVWLQPLPWAYSFLGKMVQSAAIAENRKVGPLFAKSLLATAEPIEARCHAQ